MMLDEDPGSETRVGMSRVASNLREYGESGLGHQPFMSERFEDEG